MKHWGSGFTKQLALLINSWTMEPIFPCYLADKDPTTPQLIVVLLDMLLHLVEAPFLDHFWTILLVDSCYCGSSLISVCATSCWQAKILNIYDYVSWQSDNLRCLNPDFSLMKPSNSCCINRQGAAPVLEPPAPGKGVWEKAPGKWKESSRSTLGW